MLAIDAIDCFEFVEVDHEDRRLDHIDKIHARRRQHFAQVLKSPSRFDFNPAFDQSPRCRVETNLPGVFAAGDVRYGSVKRCAAAIGEGSMAVALVHRRLAEVGGD